jgi:hypothetical protein
MKKTTVSALLTLALSAASLSAAAGVVQTFGAGSALNYPAQYAADFDGNTLLANHYSEGGLLFSYVGSEDNGGCGFAGVHCEANPGDNFSAAFSGNYMGTDGLGAYISIKSTLRDLTAIEFAVDSGYLDIFGFWQTFNDSVRTGSGNFNLGAAGVGGVIGLSDAAGFDEVRYYAFSSDNNTNITRFSAPALDSVRAFSVPEPSSAVLAALAGLGCLATRRQSAKSAK